MPFILLTVNRDLSYCISSKVGKHKHIHFNCLLRGKQQHVETLICQQTNIRQSTYEKSAAKQLHNNYTTTTYNNTKPTTPLGQFKFLVSRQPFKTARETFPVVLENLVWSHQQTTFLSWCHTSRRHILHSIYNSSTH